MILQHLYADANAILRQTRAGGEALPSMYVPKRVRWSIELDTDQNRPPHFAALRGEGKAGEKRGLERVLPDCKRTVGVRPILLADKPSYTLGVRVADAKRDTNRDAERDRLRTQEEHEAYKTLVQACAERTGSADMACIAAFLGAWNPDEPLLPLPDDLGAGDLITFTVDGRDPSADPAVRRFWAANGRTETESEEGGDAAGESRDAAAGPLMQCLVSGAYGPVEEMMPVSVRGIPGGQTSGMQIVSANAAAFESYGLKRAQTSPICRDAGEQFGKALNALLASTDHSKRVNGITYVFWARADTAVPLFAFAPPTEDPAEMRKFLEAIHRGDTSWAGSLPPDTAFRLFGLSANAARVVVRSALDTTIGEIGRRQAEWFERLQIVDRATGQIGAPLPLWRLAAAPFRERKDTTPGVEDALVRAALNGEPLPETLLRTVVMRCRLDTANRVTYARAALIKFILTQEWPLEEAHRMSHETVSNLPAAAPPPQAAAYHCGRLFAELEDIQRRALPGINATISDRYFGSASAAPASVFGLLLAGAQNHLAKLRKENEGAFHGADRRLQEILSELKGFPRTLALRDQALFSLGYYHHKAARRAAITERAAAKQKQNAESLTLALGEEASAQNSDDDTTTDEENS